MVNKQNFRTIPSTDLKGHRKYFGKLVHICQLIRIGYHIMYVLNQATAISILSGTRRSSAFSLALWRPSLANRNLYKISHRLLYVHYKIYSFV